MKEILVEFLNGTTSADKLFEIALEKDRDAKLEVVTDGLNGYAGVTISVNGESTGLIPASLENWEWCGCSYSPSFVDALNLLSEILYLPETREDIRKRISKLLHNLNR